MKKKYVIYIILYFLFNLSYSIQQVSGQTLDSETCIKCDVLATLRIKSTDLLSSVVVPEDGDIPEYCRVLG